MAAAKTKLCLALVLFSFLVLCTSVALATQDPELKQCRHQCKHQEQFTERQQEECMQRCDDYYRQKKERERQQKGQEGEEWSVEEHSKKQLRDCQRQCERSQEGRQQKEICSRQCVERFGRGEEEEEEPWGRREREKRMGNRREEWEEEEREEEEAEEIKSRNPYVFEEEHFRTSVETQHGRFSVLPNFSKRSKLLHGIENFRLGILQTNPRTLVVPHHADADVVFIVLKGRATITLILQNRRNNINVEQGDIVKVPAGTPVYITNRDDNQKLYIAEFFKPVNTPGKFEVFHGAGGQDPESFLTAFSWEVLESAFDVERDKLERMLRQQQQGSIVEASREQIEALSGRDEEGFTHHWPFGGETKGGKGSKISSFNIFDQRPSHSNQYGRLFEVDSDDYKHLHDLDLRISFANITQGSMTVPYYNSRSTKISLVLDGEGHLEMACPHLTRSSSRGKRGEQTDRTYQKVRARLRRGTTFITPAGHPVVELASENNNLQVLCFEVNAENNIRYTLAGKGNIFNHMHREAKELAFNFPSRDVDRIFRKQEEGFFLPGPSKRRGRGRGYAAV